MNSNYLVSRTRRRWLRYGEIAFATLTFDETKAWIQNVKIEGVALEDFILRIELSQLMTFYPKVHLSKLSGLVLALRRLRH